MFGISKKTAIKASLAAVASTAISLMAVLTLVPVLGGHPDGPGFWMSVILPLAISWPASAHQFAQNEKVRRARDQVAAMNVELERMHAELLATHAALQRKSSIDGLTGALNRDTFFTRLEAANADARTSALLIADADHFKNVNDEFGHQVGDDALRGIAGAISSSLGPRDFWGRIGGEEFAIYLGSTNEETARMVADRIRLGVLAIDLRVDDKTVPVSVSIGGSCSAGSFDIKRLVAEADRRLYRAKNEGRNRIVLRDADAKSAAA